MLAGKLSDEALEFQIQESGGDLAAVKPRPGDDAVDVSLLMGEEGKDGVSVFDPSGKPIGRIT